MINKIKYYSSLLSLVLYFLFEVSKQGKKSVKKENPV